VTPPARSGSDDASKRVAYLERENRRISREAQGEADEMFAQYQLSQLLASGGNPAELARSVATELVRLSGAATVGVWLASPHSGELRLSGHAGTESRLPQAFDSPAEADAWAAASPDHLAVTLVDREPVGVVGLVGPAHVRLLQLSRHELAVAFRGAQARELLDRERQELAALVEGATDAIVQVDGDRRVVRINPAGEQLIGRQASEAIGVPCWDLLGCEFAADHGPLDCPFSAVLAGGEPMAYRELAAWRPNRSVVRLIGSFTSTEGDQAAGEPSRRATAILRDVSAAQALAELREGFVATVSHELRTPLALIKGYADTLLHLEIDDESRRRFVERIQASTEQLTRLVNDVLDIARLDADPLVLERAPIQIGAIVARLRDDLGDSGGADRLRVRISQRLPPVEADGARIGQVLDNLISNARKYAPGDTPITVSARVDGDTVVTSVEDRGIGIPTGDEELVFEPFHRGRNVRELSTPGTGLGLHISRRIVAAHGGRLWLERTESGTRVSFSLPMLVPAQSRPSAWAQGDG